MTLKLFVDFCPPLKEIEFVLISEKNELCATSYSTNLARKMLVKLITGRANSDWSKRV